MTATSPPRRVFLYRHPGFNSRELSDLIVRIAEGDRDAFTNFHRQTCGELRAYLSQIVVEQDLIEDILQDVFLKIWTKAYMFDAAQNAPFGWMIRIARNHYLDKIRSKKNEEAWESDISLSNQPDPNPNPCEIVTLQSEIRALNRCLNNLDKKIFNTLMPIYYGNLTHMELAERTLLPLGTVKSRIRRGLTTLKAALKLNIVRNLKRQHS